jgi:hypothetical protein
MTPDERAEGDRPTAPPRRRRRRWPWVLLAVAGIVIVLILLLPTLLSTAAGPWLIETVANRRIRGTLEVDSLDVSWGGPTTLRDVRAFDPTGREVLHVRQAVYSAGMWGLITSPLTFDTLTVTDPHAQAHVDEDGDVSLAEAFELVEPSDGEPPRIRGQVRIQGGNVRVVHVRAMARPYEIRELQVNAVFDTLNDISGDLRAKAAGQGELSATFEARGLFQQGDFDLSKVSGQLALQTPEALDVAPLADAFGGEMTGLANLSARARMNNGVGDGNVEMTVSGFSAPAQGAAVEPIDAGLAGDFRADSQRIQAQMTADAAGQVRANLSWAPGDEAPAVTVDRLLSAAMTGRDVAMPPAAVNASGRIDIARLWRAVPGLLELRDDASLQSGELVIKQLDVAGGRSPSFSGEVNVQNAVLRQNGQASRWQDITLVFDGRLSPGVGLDLGRLLAQAQWGRIEASGTPRELDANYRINLSDLHSQLGQLLDLGGTAFSGGVAGTAQLRRATEDQLDYVLNANVNDFVYASGDTRAEIGQGTVDQQGSIFFQDNRLRRLDVTRTTINLDEEIIVNATGHLIRPSGQMQSDIDVQRASIAYADAILSGLAGSTRSQLAGGLSGTASIARPDSQSAFTSEGQMTVRGLAHQGTVIEPGDTVVQWTGLRYKPSPGALAVQQATVNSASTRAIVQSLVVERTPDLDLAGTVEVASNLATVAALAQALGAMELPEMSGAFNWNHAFAAANGRNRMPITGKMVVENFRLGEGETAFTEPRILLDYSAQLDRGADSLVLNSLNLTSDILSSQASGSINELSGAMVTDISGQYRANWDRLTSVIRQFSPEIGQDIAMTGYSEGPLRIQGPANSAALDPPFRGLQARTSVNWRSGTLFGVDLGPAELAPLLAQAVVTVPVTEVAASGGVLRLGGMVDLAGPWPLYVRPERLVVLERVRVTPQTARAILSRINPLFYDMATIDGTASLSFSEMSLPLSDEIQQHGSGRGVLDLSQLTIEPRGPAMTGLLGLLELTGPQTLLPHSVLFTINDGRVSFREFQIDIGRESVFFDGSVGFDDTVDMGVSLPVGASLLRTLGARGPVDDWATVLEGVRVRVPIVGTRSDPRLDTASVDIGPLVNRATELLIRRQLQERLTPQAGTQPQSPPSPQPAPPPGLDQQPATQPQTAPATRPAERQREPLRIPIPLPF